MHDDRNAIRLNAIDLGAMVNQLNLVFRREVSVRDGLANAVRDAQQELDSAWAQIGGGK